MGLRHLLKSPLQRFLGSGMLSRPMERAFAVFVEAVTPGREMCQRFAAALEGMGATVPEEHIDERWERLEPLYTAARRQLHSDRLWRYGPLCVWDSIEPVFRALGAEGQTVEGRVYCDLGCGRHHPLGASAVMYLNGARETIAVDVQPANERRAAEALYDLLLACGAHPEDWHWPGTQREAYEDRIRRFDLKALRAGDLASGLAGTPLRHEVADIDEVAIVPGSVDIMSSRAVLEHFLEFDSACAKLSALMAPGSIAYHFVDLVDHRAYCLQAYHWWSFLAEGEGWSDGLCNRLRASEIRKGLERAGLEFVSQERVERAAMPPGFRDCLAGRFARMPDDELAVLRVAYVMKKA